MNDNQTNWTPFPDDNLLGLTDKNQINEIEAKGMYQFIDNLNFKISIAENRSEHIDCLVYAHYEFIKIHPFNNGNGRTGRILMNIVAMKFGYQPLELYFREGESRKFYIGAMKEADNGNYEILSQLIGEELVSF